MKILTLNLAVDIGGVKPLDKVDALGRLVQAHKPEYIVLQGLNTETIKLLKVQNWATRYKLSSPPVSYENRKKPWCAIMSIYPLNEMKVFNYRNPDTFRYVMWCDIPRTDKQKLIHPLIVATTQLNVGPTLEQSEIREKQLNQALFCLKDYEDCFFLGDFGLIDPLDGEIEYNGGWQDAYIALGSPPGSENTFVPENTLIKEKSIPSLRLDRALFKARRYALDGIQLVATEPDPKLTTHISNHYGILITFHLLDNASFLPATPPADVPCTFNRPDFGDELTDGATTELNQ